MLDTVAGQEMEHKDPGEILPPLFLIYFSFSFAQ